MSRYVIKIGGESGQGVNSTGEILVKALKSLGYKTFGYREYPSLIKGGYASFQIDFSEKEIRSSSSTCNVLLCLSRISTHKYLKSLNKNGTLIHIMPHMHFSKEEQDFIIQNNIKVLFIDATKYSIEIGGDNLFANIVALSYTWKLLRFEPTRLEEFIKEQFADKPKFLEIDLKCIKKGFDLSEQEVYKVDVTDFEKMNKNTKDLLITGNHALALGAIAAGVRAYYAYPMTPASSILSYLANQYKKTGMIVRQVEDEISAAQMTLGSMFMGTRALTGTSGGGFDLMSETISASAITETPFVCILAQRPGPATGLPTWTSASDLLLAVTPSHGEYVKCVIAVSDIESCFIKIQEALNISEEFQIPVIVLTEKQIAESYFQVERLPDAIEIKRGLVSNSELETLKPTDRFKLTESGVSPRWFPGQSVAAYDANTDEHSEDGTSVEESKLVIDMFEKRMKKEAALLQILPEPELFGSDDANITLIGWGSVKNAVLDTLNELKNTSLNPLSRGKIVNYLHYEYIWPLKTEKLNELIKKGNKLILIENNYEGQLGKLITQQTGYVFEQKILRFDGRPFFVDEIRDKINDLI